MGCPLFLSFTANSAAAGGVLPLQTVVRGDEFSLPRREGFRLGHASPLFRRQHLFGSHLTHSYYLVRSFDLLITSTHREIATISHTVIHCDKEIHNYSPYKLHHMLTWLLSAWLFGTPFNLRIQHHRNIQWSRQRWLLPGGSEVLGGGAMCWLLLGRPWAEHRRGCPCPSLSRRSALFLVLQLKIISDSLSHSDSERENAKVCWWREHHHESSWLPNACIFYPWESRGWSLCLLFPELLCKLWTAHAFPLTAPENFSCNISAVKYCYTL